MIGYTILGDELYGGNLTLAKRQMLHAYKLEFDNPDGKDKINIEIDIPNDMKDVLEN